MVGTPRLRMRALLALTPAIPILLWASMRGESAPPDRANMRLHVSIAERTLKVIRKAGGSVPLQISALTGRAKTAVPV
jgi:hypothetical protein